MMVFNKLAVKAFPLPCTLVALQMGFTVVVMCTLSWKNLHIGSTTDLMRWLIVVPFFVGMLLTSICALQGAPMSLVITFRALTPLLTLMIERLYPNPPQVTSASLSALLLMVAGAVLYARDLQSYKADKTSYHALGWICLNTLFACTERLLQRKMLDKNHSPVDMSKASVSMVNNLFGMFPLIVAAVLTNETSQIAPTLAHMTWSGYLMVFLSCVVGVGISIAAIWAQTLVSATSMLVLTNANKFAVILTEIYVLPETHAATRFQIGGAVFAIVASVLYAKIREEEEKIKKEEDQRKKEIHSDEEATPLIPRNS